jgi:hypothetical protein
MNKSDIEGLSAREIKQKYALLGVPTDRVDVKPPAGTHVNVGGAAGNGYGSGGGRQWYLDVEDEALARNSDRWFRNSRKIK